MDGESRRLLSSKRRVGVALLLVLAMNAACAGSGSEDEGNEGSADNVAFQEWGESWCGYTSATEKDDSGTLGLGLESQDGPACSLEQSLMMLESLSPDQLSRVSSLRMSGDFDASEYPGFFDQFPEATLLRHTSGTLTGNADLRDSKIRSAYLNGYAADLSGFAPWPELRNIISGVGEGGLTLPGDIKEAWPGFLGLTDATRAITNLSTLNNSAVPIQVHLPYGHPELAALEGNIERVIVSSEEAAERQMDAIEVLRSRGLIVEIGPEQGGGRQ